MPPQSVTLALPAALYEQLKVRAQQRHRSLEDETVDVLATAIPAVDQLLDNLASATTSLALLGDEDLWRAARSHFAPESAAALESLHVKRQRDGLTDAERATMLALTDQYERAMLVRATAAKLLRERGHDLLPLEQGPGR